MSHVCSAETDLINSSRDGHAQFGRLDLETGAYYGEASGQSTADAIGAIEFHFDVTH
jgi:hypothetical protein